MDNEDTFAPNDILTQIATTNVPGFVAAPNASNNYAIPEFSQLQKELFAVPSGDSPIEQKARYLQEKWGKQGFTFTIDEQGNMQINNTPETQAAVGIKSSNPLETKFGAGIQSQMEAIRNAASPDEAIGIYTNLVGQVASNKAKLWDDSFKLAATKLGVPSLEAELQNAERLDRADPRWNDFQADSPITAKLRAQLQSVRSQVDDVAKTFLAANPSLAAIDAQMKAIGPLVERQQKIAETWDTFKAQKVFMSEMKKEEENQKLLEAASPEILQRAVIVEPSLTGSSPIQIMKNLKTMKDSGAAKTQLEAIFADPESLTSLAIGHRNPAAVKILAAKEAEATGQSIPSITDQFKFMDRTLSNETKMQQLARQVYGSDKLSLDQFSQSQKLAKFGNKEEKLAGEAAKVNLLLNSMVRTNENQFMGNVAGWSGYNDPAMTEAINKAASVAGKPDMENVVAAYLGDSIGTERQAKLDQLRQNIRTAVTNGPGKSLIAPVDPQTIINYMEKVAIGKTLGMKLKDALTPTLQVGNPLNAIYMVTHQGQSPADQLKNFFGG